jgi:hypothetical protein
VVEAGYFSIRSLSAYSGLSIRTLRLYLHHSTRPLPHFRIGGKILVRRSDFDTWADGFRVASSDRVATLVDSCLKGLL